MKVLISGQVAFLETERGFGCGSVPHPWNFGVRKEKLRGAIYSSLCWKPEERANCTEGDLKLCMVYSKDDFCCFPDIGPSRNVFSLRGAEAVVSVPDLSVLTPAYRIDGGNPLHEDVQRNADAHKLYLQKQ